MEGPPDPGIRRPCHSSVAGSAPSLSLCAGRGSQGPARLGAGCVRQGTTVLGAGRASRGTGRVERGDARLGGPSQQGRRGTGYRPLQRGPQQAGRSVELGGEGEWEGRRRCGGREGGEVAAGGEED